MKNSVSQFKGSVVIISLKTWPQTCTNFTKTVRSNFMIFWQCYLEPKMKLTVFLFFQICTLLQYFLNTQKTFLYFDQFCDNTILKLHEFGIKMMLMDIAFSPFFSFFGKMDGLRLITYLVKFLPKLSKIEGDKNFLKRGEVDVIYFRPLIIILLIFKDFSKL